MWKKSLLVYLFFLRYSFQSIEIVGQYGIPLPWNFPFSSQYWIENLNEVERKMSDESLTSLSNEREDQNSIIVQIESLTKSFPQTNRTVVNNVSFNLYQNQITALLGHNGAG